MRFFYHVHGYEFQPSPDGTLMDTLIKQSPADAVDFQADVFWVVRGGGNPVQLLTTYPGRFKLVHLKDLEKGVATNDPTGSAPDETSVVLGTGQLDFPAILKAARSKRRHALLHRGRAPRGGGADPADARLPAGAEGVSGDVHVPGCRVHDDADLRIADSPNTDAWC